MFRFFSVACLLLLTAMPGAAQDADPLNSALDRIGPEGLRKDVSTLASDAYEGRAAGFPGADKAAEYIAGIFKEHGLKPGGIDGTYFQPFSFNRRKIEFSAK